MIKANELRIGNWLKAGPLHENLFPGGYLQLKGLDRHYIFATTNNALRFKDIDPIPLTPEILEKAGFKHTNTLHDETMTFKGKPYVYFKDGAITISCSVIKYKYLHQLQNLIFALTGTEITINL